MRNAIALDVEASRWIRKDLLAVRAENNLPTAAATARRRSGTGPGLPELWRIPPRARVARSPSVR